jgi:hypothetical protein
MNEEEQSVEVPLEISQSIVAKFQEENEENQKNITNPIELYLNKHSESVMDWRDTFYNDELHDMTWSRRIARCLSKYQWYFPREHGDVKNLDRAWAYFEHSALPRRYMDEDESSDLVDAGSTLDRKGENRNSKRADYGVHDRRTKLYDVFNTPESELAEFGLGVGIYFWTLRVLAVITFVAGIINVPNMVYFASSEYTGSAQWTQTSIGAVGSALCTDTRWVACPTCTMSQWERRSKLSTFDRIATGDGLMFILKNNCSITFKQGLVSWISLMFVCVSVYVMGWVSKRKERRFDESQQTAADYSIEVANPPKNAVDPDEWNNFFSQFDDSHVTMVTVAFENKSLIRALVQRRMLIREMEYLIKPGIAFDEKNLDEMVSECSHLTWWKKWILWKYDGPVLLDKIRKQEDLAKTRASKSASASKVFVTFETEQAQRNVLKALSISRLNFWLGNALALPKACAFRGNHVLWVREPAEPTSVRWQDLDQPLFTRIIRVSLSFAVTLVIIACGATLITRARRRSAFAAAMTINIINQVTPRISRMITNRFESHSNNGSRQASLYVKMTLLKWVNTAIVTTLILPFTDTAQEGKGFLINSVWAIFATEMLLNPLINFSDSWGNIQRHFLGPRSPDQQRMNLNFRGGHVDLAERYTEMTKILFLCFFYSAIFPAGFFMAAVTLSIQYCTDKFALLRTWGPEPDLGGEVADFSRNYFFTAALVVFALMQSYNFAGWPFDNACETLNGVQPEYLGTTDAITGEGVPVQITIRQGDIDYFYCLQDMLRFQPRAFPAIPAFQTDGGEWMSADQEKVAYLMGWTSVAVICFVAAIFVNRVLLRVLRGICFKVFSPRGTAMDDRFSECANMSGYIPQVNLRQNNFEFPMLACDISKLKPELIEFQDPTNKFPFDEHNLIYDVQCLSDSTADESKQIFSIVKLWQPDLRSHLKRS